MGQHVEFKHEDQDRDGMAIGPAWIVTPDDRIPVAFTESQGPAWFRLDSIREWAASNGHEVHES